MLRTRGALTWREGWTVCHNVYHRDSLTAPMLHGEQVVVPVAALAILGRRFYMRYLWQYLKARRERRSHLHRDPGNGVRDLNV